MDNKLRHQRIMQVHRNRLAVLIILFLLICGVVLIQVKANNASLADSQKVLQEKTAKLEKAKKNKAQLKITVQELKDPKYIEKWLRSKYFYSKEGETIYNFGAK